MKTDIKVLISDAETLIKNSNQTMDELRVLSEGEYCSEIWFKHTSVTKNKNRALNILQDLIAAKTILNNTEYYYLIDKSVYSDLELNVLDEHIEKYKLVFLTLDYYVKESDHIINITRSKSNGYIITEECLKDSLALMNFAKNFAKSIIENENHV